MAARLSVEPVALIYFVVIYLEYIVLQDVIYDKLCLQITNSSSSESCNKSALSDNQLKEISKNLSYYNSIYLGILNGCTLIACLFTGSWSDSFGRRPMMALPSILGLVSEVIFIICSIKSIPNVPVIPLVMIAGIFNGISGGSATVLAACFGYIADITTVTARTRRLSYLEAAFIIGGFVGSYTTSLILKSATFSTQTTHIIAFCLCILLHLTIIAYIWSISETDRPLRPPDRSHVASMIRTVTQSRPSRSLIISLCALGIANSCSTSTSLTLSFPWLKQAVKWSSSSYSFYNGTHLLMGGLSLILLLPLLQRLFPNIMTDSVVGFLGFTSKSFGWFNFAFVTTSLQVYLGLPLFLMSDYSMPAIRSLMSQAVSQHERGKAFAFLAAVQTVASFAFSFALPAIFRHSPASLPGLTFLLAASLEILAALFMLFLSPPSSSSSYSSPHAISSPSSSPSSPHHHTTEPSHED